MSQSSSNMAASYPAPGRAAHITAWVLQVLLALTFLSAGGAKLIGAAMMVETFEQIGLGQGFRYVTGIVEIIGAIALLAPRTTAPGALWLAATMLGATLAHLIVLPTPAIPALILLALCLLLAWLRRGQLRQWAAQLSGARA